MQALRVICGFMVLLGALLSCKTANKDSNIKSEADIEPGQIQWVEGERKWAITCREGRLHNGFRSALVRTEDLRTACEEVDPNQGGGNTGGGGNNGGGGNEWSLESKCPNRPEQVAKVTIALSPEFVQELQAMQPAVARQRLCVGFASKFNQLLSNTPSFFKALTGEESGSPILVMVGPPSTPVEFDEDSLLMQMPWKISEETLLAMETAFENSSISFCPAGGGRRTLGACWWLGDLDKSCNQVCADLGLQYSSTTSVASATRDNCHKVGAKFNLPTVNPSNVSCNAGCVYCTGSCSSSYKGVWNCPSNNPGDREDYYQRFCSCK